MFRSIIIVLCVVIGTSLSLPFGTERIVNGTDAEDAEFPYIVSLRNARTGSHSCGASVLSPFWILTAAHCVQGRSPSSINIQYGVTEISPDKRNVSEIAKIIVHEKYDSHNIVNDIALIQLQTPMKLGKFVKSIKLPRKNQPTPANSSALLIGWGLNMSGGFIQKKLQKVNLIIFSNKDCNARHHGRIYPSNICAGVPEGGKGQCSGDSGGPLTVDGVQVGIVSWSVKPCTIAPYPGVFTRVASFVDWIQSKINLDLTN